LIFIQAKRQVANKKLLRKEADDPFFSRNLNGQNGIYISTLKGPSSGTGFFCLGCSSRPLRRSTRDSFQVYILEIETNIRLKKYCCLIFVPPRW
jgi:hypothetical protein